MMKIKIALTCTVLLTMISASALTLPDNTTELTSQQGQTMFRSANINHDYWPLSRYYSTQQYLTTCSLASAAMALNALGIKPTLDSHYAPYHIMTEDNIFNKAVLHLITPTQVERSGMSLSQLASVLRTYLPKTIYKYATSITESQFRKDAITAINDPNSIIIVNFNHTFNPKTPLGHFSPLAAYNKTKDSFLILDVSRYKYPPFWVKTDMLYHAMKEKDDSSKLSRGYIITKK